MYFNNFGGGAVYRLSAAPSLRRQNKTTKASEIISRGLIFISNVLQFHRHNDQALLRLG